MLFQMVRHAAAMQCDPFSARRCLSDWPESVIEVRCACSARVAMLPVRMLLQKGDRTFANAVRALRCKSCNGKPAPAYLVHGHN